MTRPGAAPVSHVVLKPAGSMWLRSKESGNCRLELNYGQQNEGVDMIPLMMEPDYRPKGCASLANSAVLLSLHSNSLCPFQLDVITPQGSG